MVGFSIEGCIITVNGSNDSNDSNPQRLDVLVGGALAIGMDIEGMGKYHRFAISRAYCLRSRNRLIVSCAADLFNDKLVRLKLTALISSREEAGLPDAIYLAKGMPVLVTVNVETEMDVANGSHAIIDDIIVHGDEATNDEPMQDEHEPLELYLKRPPACVLVKLSRTRAAPIDNLGEGVIPIVPTQNRFQLTVPGQSKKITISHQQIPLIPAYAFTDYRAQGQTLPYVIIDIGKPPTGGITPFNAYVALS